MRTGPALATEDISRRIQTIQTDSSAAVDATEIASNITGVATAAQSTSAGVSESRRTAEDLARMSGDLQQLVGQFRY
ncbi:MAG: putative methyl-accepting chemotaxis protein [Dactylosporangium sp.]|nr:putative methyl-accepting chemotaxis protein [Dactylosporangium sp.]